jgi:hypothetical protein
MGIKSQHFAFVALLGKKSDPYRSVKPPSLVSRIVRDLPPIATNGAYVYLAVSRLSAHFGGIVGLVPGTSV